MAMIKKEKADAESALNKLLILSALRWTEPVKPDVPIPAEGIVNGWLFNTHTASVVHACSSSISHAYGRWDNTTQGSRELYSSQVRALRACRHAVELECAAKLAKIDALLVVARF